MANRRMFSKTVMQSDKFLDMPFSAQALYVQLGINADDDGFLVSPRATKRLTGASDDDFDTLVENGFLIPFNSGAVAIAHWKVNNEIKGDRYKETDCKKEKAMLGIDENKRYFVLNAQHGSNMVPVCVQSGSRLEPQVNISKVNISKDNLSQDKKEEGEEEFRKGVQGKTIEEPAFVESECLSILTNKGVMHIFTQDEIAAIREEKPGIDLSGELSRLNAMLEQVGSISRPKENEVVQYVISHVK